MTSSRTFQRYQRNKRDSAIREMEEIIKRLKRGSIQVESHGYWDTHLGNKVIFRIDLISDDSDKFLANLYKNR